jgi:putative ABC transport system permease protein
MWKLALRNVLRHKSRTGMTLLAIMGGVISLILSGGFIADMIDQFGEILIHSQSGHIQVARVGYFAHGARSPEKFSIRDPEPVRQVISALPEVDDVMERLYFTGLLNNGRADQPIIGEGIEPAREAHLGTGIIIAAGRSFQDSDRLAMMVGKGLARALKLKPGDVATLVTNTPDGAVNSLEFEVVGVFQTFSKDYDARAVHIPLAAAHELLDTKGINTLVVALRQTSATDATAANLNVQFAQAGLEAKTWIELNDFYANTVDMYDAQFGVLRIIILLMVLLSVANSVNMSVFERVGEFGTMMALGNRSRHVFALIMAENAIIGLVGAGLGAVLGIGLALAISAVGIPMPPPPNSDMAYIAHIRIVPTGVASAFLIGLVATAAAALLPGARVRSIPVVDALRQNI